MRDNLYCSSDSNVITKKFWAHVKSKTKSIRIPESMKHKYKGDKRQKMTKPGKNL